MNITVQDFAEQRRNLAHDFHRPVYHFISPANWMNDPNGVTYWGDQYHLFYQYNPERAAFGIMHWGHAVSQNLIHWQDLPLALSPTPGGPDERGSWSGCLFSDNGVPTIMYTGARGDRYQIQTQCLATSSDQLLTWEKYSGNPVLSKIPAISGQDYDFRDPFVWREVDAWYMVLACRIKDVGGSIFLYKSADLINWEFMHPLATGDIKKNGSVWECPSFFPLGDKWVLIVAGKGGNIPFTVFYFIGDYANQRFTPESHGVLDYAYFYAPYSMQDRQGRRLLFGWVREGRSEEAHLAAGWAGMHAIPRVLTLRDGHLHMEPIEELHTLRGEQVDVTNISLSGEDIPLDVQGLALDISAEFEAAGPVGIALACALDGSEQTRIVYDPQSKRLTVDRSQSSLGEENETSPDEAPHELASDESLQLRILLDGSVLEVIANGRTSILSRIYPSRPDSKGVKVFGQGVLKSLSAAQMRSIWPE